VDHRSDLYSLGAVLYEALTGQPPFVAQSAPEYIYKHMSVAPKRVTQVKGLPHKIPRHCAKAVMACLEKEPDQRPASAALLADMLQRGETITQGQVAIGPLAAGAPAGGGRRVTVIGIAVAALVAVVVGGVLLLGRDQGRADQLRPAGVLAAAEVAQAILDQEAAKPVHVMILVKTTPASAQVSLLSPERRPLGMTPLLYKARRADQKWQIVVTADGHRSRTLELVTDRDRTFEIALERLPTAPEAVQEQVQRSAEEAKAERAAQERRPSRRREALKKSAGKKKDGAQPASMRGRRKIDAIKTIDPFE
jgi:hypothetical protein